MPQSQVSIKWCTSKNSEFFSSIMKLRYEAYSADDRLTWQRSWKNMYDQWDEKAIIAVVMLDDVISGSIRITINNNADELSYPFLYFPNRYLTDSQLITQEQYVESSRLCIKPSARGKGLWYLLAAQMIKMTKRTGRQYIVGSAIDELIPTRSKIGFRKTGHRYLNKDINGKIHEMMILNIPDVLKGNCDKAFHDVLLDVLNLPIEEGIDVQSIFTAYCS
jgi:N-acyl-L-homoserine lactone synthetase